MNIIVRLNPGQGAELGANFTLSSNAGSVTPSSATLDQLLVGINVTVNNGATQIYVTSEGVCTNTLTLPISTTTSTTTFPVFNATTSSVSAYEACSNPEAPSYTFTIIGGVGTGMCDDVQIRSIYIESIPPGSIFWTYNGLNVREWQVLLSPSGYNYAIGYSNCTSCPTTTTTSTTTSGPTTTTTSTTTIAPAVRYNGIEWFCGSCTNGDLWLIDFPEGFTPVIGKFYVDTVDNKVFSVYAEIPYEPGVGFPVGNIAYDTCSSACAALITTTTTTAGPFNFSTSYSCSFGNIVVDGFNTTGGVAPYYYGTTYFSSEAAALANTSWFLADNAGYGVGTVDNTFWIVAKDSMGTILAKPIITHCVSTTTVAP